MAQKKKTKPEFQPTKAQRAMVEIWASGRMTQVRMALALGIDVKTLVKHFDHELNTGAAKRDAKVLEAQYKNAIDGNASAQKTWLARADLVPEGTGRSTAPEKKEPPLGKKMQEVMEASTAVDGTAWEDVLTPPSTTTPQ